TSVTPEAHGKLNMELPFARISLQSDELAGRRWPEPRPPAANRLGAELGSQPSRTSLILLSWSSIPRHLAASTHPIQCQIFATLRKKGRSYASFPSLSRRSDGGLSPGPAAMDSRGTRRPIPSQGQAWRQGGCLGRGQARSAR